MCVCVCYASISSSIVVVVVVEVVVVVVGQLPAADSSLVNARRDIISVASYLVTHTHTHTVSHQLL